MRPETSRGVTTIIQIVDKLPQEQVKHDRKTLQVLQQAAGTDKENLVGSGRSLRTPSASKDGLQIVKEVIDEKKTMIQEHLNTNSATQANKRQKKMHNSIIKGKSKVKPEDLLNDEPSEKYWSIVAEKRRIALETALEENEALHERVRLLEEENVTTKQLLEETNHVIELLQEMVSVDQDQDTSNGSVDIESD